MPQTPENDTGSLERARERLYIPGVPMRDIRASLTASSESSLPHAWQEDALPDMSPRPRARRGNVAGIFLMVYFVFFII